MCVCDTDMTPMLIPHCPTGQLWVKEVDDREIEFINKKAKDKYDEERPNTFGHKNSATSKVKTKQSRIWVASYE